jgi:hypothetical protein
MASNSSVEEAFEKVKHLIGVERLKTEQLSILTLVERIVLPSYLQHYIINLKIAVS